MNEGNSLRNENINRERKSNEEQEIPSRKQAQPSIRGERRSGQYRRRDYYTNNEEETYSRAADDHPRKDVRDVVRTHYNARPDMGTRKRQFSPIIQLKRFNNWIKSVLIQKFTPRVDDRPLLVLDLGCGKGGDLIKWDKAGIDGYIGVDIAENSVDQAKRRYRELQPCFDALFYAGDCFSRSVSEFLPPDQRQFDIVSLQFCLHYAFESELKARRLLENVSKCLPRGGIMLGTIPNSDIISQRLKELPPSEVSWGNDIYSVRFTQRPSHTFRPPFGIQYFFYLEDAVTDVPEYVVPFEAFRAIAETYDLELLWQKPFVDIFNEEKNSEAFGNLMERMKVVDSNGKRGIDPQELEAASFYLAFAFEKRGI
ncbi:P-TEFb-cap methyltransferase Pcm1 [Schizosaccharomyces cryophilus OY26]|uniref:mRNA cap guanine-N(7) methyltransferase n=1 Tax=Schizosaccharomyces cryophilus (strain OY26 / ATCC MYA-4695 / CBS 11777 / NBRC 106824 / NRRL Y48691) TaxID=653667 RepID=S9VV62_SCHCR|nr:P-TEFb-cap methyltransferase Pcm1 [Schizosaccharomyces cryophilus OY26]EPY50079.1 P-TEFb-cap methyltransferase Pcm1 [Schizosaccharomyces cryophilus OY26]